MIMSMKVLSEIRRLHRQKSTARNPELIMVTMTQIPIASNPSDEDEIEGIHPGSEPAPLSFGKIEADSTTAAGMLHATATSVRRPV